MLKLLFDFTALQPCGNVINHGGAEYAKIILIELLKSTNVLEICGFYDKNQIFPENIKRITKEFNISLIEINKINDVENILYKFKYDIFYSADPYKFYKIIIPDNTRAIYTIHGLRNIEMPADKYEIFFCKNLTNFVKIIFKLLFLKKYIFIQLKKVRLLLEKLNDNCEIVVVSNHTKYSILSKFNRIDHNRINVFYSPRVIYNKINNTEINGRNIFLLISANRWQKNSYRGIKALDKVFNDKKFTNYHAVILGTLPNPVLKRIKNINKFIIRGYVSRDELEELLSRSFFLLYPSLNEGFGYPPVEAMKYGTPTLASAISSIPEICRDAALYFNPYSIDEMVSRIYEISELKNYSMLSTLCLKRYDEITKKQDSDLEKLVNLITSDINI